MTQSSAAAPLGHLHAAALVVGTTGLLVTGPSGAGKSAMALALIQSAAAHGRFARLVADDQVCLEIAGGAVIAAAPETIAGLIEIRGCGIAAVPFLRRAVIRFALAPAQMGGPDRVPPNESLSLGRRHALPVIRMPYGRPIDAFSTLTAIVGRL